MKAISTYYQKIIDLILKLNKEDFSNAKSGHCMKITGLGLNELSCLWDNLIIQYPDIQTFIISEQANDETKFISPTKLIEMRNQQAAPLLVLIPSNSRTAAEDSYGNATFKEISLEGIEAHLQAALLEEIPLEYEYVIKEEILKYLSTTQIQAIHIIKYLLELAEKGYTPENIGNFIYLLTLIPDSSLLVEKEKVRSRLNFNLESIALLTAFSRPLYDRITDLPLDSNTLKKGLSAFIKQENGAKNAAKIARLIYEKYPHLNFSKWNIPDLDFTHIKLFTEEIVSNSFTIEDGKKTLRAETNKTAKVRIRFSTNPNPKDISDLKYFKVVLMQVDGNDGVEILVLRKLKNTDSTKAFRDATVELNPNVIEEGSYFFRVLAEDNHGNILNANDDFKDTKIQKAWEEAKALNPEALKSAFPFKLSCDSEDFYYIVEDMPPPPENQRKDKVNNVLQAFFKYRIERLKKGEELGVPIPSASSNIWLNHEKLSHSATFHINYSEKHNYQIILSSKLRLIEEMFLNHSDALGYVKGVLKSNSTAIGYESLSFERSELTSIIPQEILTLRKQIFDKIKHSTEQKNGIFETADIFNFIDDIKSYVETFTEWTSKIKLMFEDDKVSQEEKSKIQHLFTELQILDIARIKTKLPDGKPIEAFLMSPLHPLRLAWTLQLISVFKDWEQKTNDNPNHKEAWAKYLDNLFEGNLSPENNPLVIVEPLTFKNYHYAGELAYGWALYLNVMTEETKNGMTSVSRQMKHFFRQLFNITKDSYVEIDISQQLIVRHIKNYISQHPYTDKLIINLINAGDAYVFADAFVELERESQFKDIKYEIRIFKGEDKIIEHGEALRTLINPEFNVSEEAEAFSQPSKNRLFPKLRFSINQIADYLKLPSRFTAHISFLVSPFPITIELIKPHQENRNFHLNGLLTDATVLADENGSEIKWSRFTKGNELPIKYNGIGKIGITLFDNIQSFIAGALASKYTESIPAAQLRLNDRDKVLLTLIHDFSDWVITFDKNVGPEIYDKPSKDGKIPFLLDYVPGEEVSGISSFLTTRPTSEILGLLGPHFEEFNLDIHKPDDEKKITTLLEDVRALSSSLILQLNSTKNKAFEVIGSAFTKRVLEKKGLLKESFLIPIDLHQNLFDNLPNENKSRADNLLVSINADKKELHITVIEIKCRKTLMPWEEEDLKKTMFNQITNTIEALRSHFDPEYQISDRLDREIKNKELKSLLSFYIERAFRYKYLSDQAYTLYLSFLQHLDAGFSIKCNKLGFIYNFSATKKHQKEILDNEFTCFTFGGKLIEEILDANSDLNTKRLEGKILQEELTTAVGLNSQLNNFLQQFNIQSEPKTQIQNTSSPESITLKSVPSIELENSSSDERNNPLNIVTDPNLEAVSIESKPLNLDNIHQISPAYDLLIGKSSHSNQYGILGETNNSRKVAIDLSETNTISLFGVQGGGKSYTIGTISEMVLKQFNNINSLPTPLAGVIFHYSESMDYEPEFTSMIYPNDKESELKKLKDRYGAEPHNIADVIILTPKDKIEDRQAEYPSIKVFPIAFNSKELNVQDWLFLLGAIGNDSTYIKQLKAIMKEQRKELTLAGISQGVEDSLLLSNAQKALARQKLSFASEYIDDSFNLRETLQPGRLIIVDLRDEFIVKDEALGLFVIMLNIFSGKSINENHFNKFIVFDEAHKYMDNKDLTSNIVTAIREMRHKGVSIMIASQDPPSLPNEIIELSSIVLLHKFNSPLWLKHIQKSITQLSILTPADMSSLSPGEGFLWSNKATEKGVSLKPIKISTRPRVTKHGGGTIQANGER